MLPYLQGSAACDEKRPTLEFSGEPHGQLSMKATLCGESAAISYSARD
jgi:hypothetical protein